MQFMEMYNQIRSAILGLAVGDALGVPVEFMKRSELITTPVTNMRSFGMHDQPAGTWSDDSSLTFCLMESLCKGFDLTDLAERFQQWNYQAYWTAHDEVFDIGISTAQAIDKLKKGEQPHLAGGTGDSSNGNGSLMRILPLAFYIQNLPITERFKKVKAVSSLTHAHFRSVFACFIYTEMAILLIRGRNPQSAYIEMQRIVADFLSEQFFSKKEIKLFDRVLLGDISQEAEDTIFGSGYVLHSLEASLWCLLNGNNYQNTVLKAVNLGDDTDTTGAIAGGLAGLCYGESQIPTDWISILARKNDILDLCQHFAKSVEK